MVKHNRGSGEDDADSGLYSPDSSDAAGAAVGGSSGVVTKLKRLLETRQESTLSAMMEEMEEEDDDNDDDDPHNYGNENQNDKKCRQQEEKKEEYPSDGKRSHEKQIQGERIGGVSRDNDSEGKDKQRQYHMQRLQNELQSRHISSLQSLNYLTPYELSIARNNLVDPADIAVSFGDVGGMDDIKSEIYDLVVLPLLRPDLFDCESGLVSPPKGILLYGYVVVCKSKETMLSIPTLTENPATFPPLFCPCPSKQTDRPVLARQCWPRVSAKMLSLYLT